MAALAIPNIQDQTVKYTAIIKATNKRFGLPKGDNVVTIDLGCLIAQGKGDDSHPVDQHIAALLGIRRDYVTGKMSRRKIS